MHPPRRILLLLLLIGMASCARRAEPPPGHVWRGTLILEDFEAFTWGGEWVTAQFTPGADPTMHAVSEPVHGGTRACRLDVPPGEGLTLLARGVPRGKQATSPLPLAVAGDLERVGLWVHGAKSGHRLWARLVGKDGRTSDHLLGVVDFEGWRHLDVAVPKPLRRATVAGLVVRGGDGPLVVDDLTAVAAMPQPLHVTARVLDADADHTDDRAVRLRVVVQALADEPQRGRIAVAAFAADEPDEPAVRRTRAFRAQQGVPSESVVSLRLSAGSYRMHVRAGAAAAVARAVVHPTRKPTPVEGVLRAARRFPSRRDSLVIYESAFSPAILLESRESTLTLFRGMQAAGLTSPREALLRRGRPIFRRKDERPAEKREDSSAAPGDAVSEKPPPPRDKQERIEVHDPLQEPWILLWFGESPAWYHVKLADGTPCPTFDVPFLVVLQNRPRDVWLDEDGLHLDFPRRAGRVVLMPLFGVARPQPSKTSRWKEDSTLLPPIVKWCRTWARTALAYPVAAHEEWRALPADDAVQVRVRFDYIETESEWGDPPLRVAPVPPLLMLASQAGLPVRFSRKPLPTGCDTAIGPWYVVPDADGYTYTIGGLSRCITEALADVPRASVALQGGVLAAGQRPADAIGRLPFWQAHGGAAGHRACEGLVRSLLWPARFRYEPDEGRRVLRALNAAAWHAGGDTAARAAGADYLRACWYVGHHAELWPLLRARWPLIRGLQAALASPGDWGTLGLGSDGVHIDAHLAAAVHFARLAARLGTADEYAAAHLRAAKLLVAAYAMTAGAPIYAARLSPWPTLAPLGGKRTALTRCRPGSLGLAPGPPALVTSPTDAGYVLAQRFLPEYLREKFSGGPFGLFGRNPTEWEQRALVTIAAPDIGAAFRPTSQWAGPYAGNHVYAVERGRDGWPCLVWASHRSPAGGPLSFGTLGTTARTRGTLHRSATPSPGLRLSAFRATPAPPTESTTPAPPAPASPSAAPAGDTPAPSPPRNTPDSAPGKGAPAK